MKDRESPINTQGAVRAGGGIRTRKDFLDVKQLGMISIPRSLAPLAALGDARDDKLFGYAEKEVED
jgi:hypothetical protein